MVKAVTMPKLGQSEETVNIVRWRKNVGETVAKGDILFEIETDKAVLEVESFYTGTLLKIVAGEGVTVPVQTTVAFVGDPGETVPEVVLPQTPRHEVRSSAPKGEKPLPRPAAQVTLLPKRERCPGLASSAGCQQTGGGSSQLQAGWLWRHRYPAPPATQSHVVPHQPSRRKTCKGVRHRSHAHCGHRSQRSNRRARREGVSGSQGYDRLRITPTAKKLAAREGINLLSLVRNQNGDQITVADIERILAERPKPHVAHAADHRPAPDGKLYPCSALLCDGVRRCDGTGGAASGI